MPQPPGVFQKKRRPKAPQGSIDLMPEAVPPIPLLMSIILRAFVGVVAWLAIGLFTTLFGKIEGFLGGAERYLWVFALLATFLIPVWVFRPIGRLFPAKPKC